MAKKDTENPYIKGRVSKYFENADLPGAPRVNMLSVPQGIDENPLEHGR